MRQRSIRKSVVANNFVMERGQQESDALERVIEPQVQDDTRLSWPSAGPGPILPCAVRRTLLNLSLFSKKDRKNMKFNEFILPQEIES